MRRGFKKILLYGGLLAAGAALGMQLVSGDPAGSYTADAGSATGLVQGTGTANTSQSSGTTAAPSVQGGRTVGTGYEQGTYVKLPDGTTYYYVQSTNPAAGGAVLPSPSTLPQIPANSTEDSGSAKDGTALYQSPGQLLLSPSPQTSVDRFADKTGELLQNASQKGIDWVVSLFGSLTD